MSDHVVKPKWGTVFARERLSHETSIDPVAWDDPASDPVGDILEAADQVSRRLDPDDILLTTQEVSEVLRLSPRTVETQMREGKIPGFRVAGRWRCSRTALRHFIASQHAQP